jgi:hypothetical protein
LTLRAEKEVYHIAAQRIEKRSVSSCKIMVILSKNPFFDKIYMIVHDKNNLFSARIRRQLIRGASLFRISPLDPLSSTVQTPALTTGGRGTGHDPC